MSFRDLPALVTQRQDALTLLEALATGVDEGEFAPFVTALMSPEDEQAAASCSDRATGCPCASSSARSSPEPAS